MVVFWSEKQSYQEAFLEMVNPGIDNQEQLENIFGNLHSGIRVDLDDLELDPDQEFFILSLAPNAGRLSVRFFYHNSFGSIIENLRRHYDRMKIVKPEYVPLDYLGIRKMLEETVNQKLKNKTPVPNMAAMVLKSVLEDAKYPARLYTDVLRRIRAEQGTVTYGRAAIIKSCLIKNYEWKEGEQCMTLNDECKDPAYILGRLFSVLESIQKSAQGEIKVTIRDRYFNSACARPASVFPILLKLENSHIKKIGRESEGKKIYYEKQVTDLIGKLEEFPKQLSLEKQGKFILGYYQQTQKKYEKKEN